MWGLYSLLWYTVYIYIYIYIYIYQVNEDCEYAKNECSINGYLIWNIPAEQNIYIFLLFKKTRNLEIVFHNKFILLNKAHQIDFKWNF